MANFADIVGPSRRPGTEPPPMIPAYKGPNIPLGGAPTPTFNPGAPGMASGGGPGPAQMPAPMPPPTQVPAMAPGPPQMPGTATSPFGQLSRPRPPVNAGPAAYHQWMLQQRKGF